MLSELGLRNFKAFGDKEQKAPLAPITLIYGPNSGGKSSIIQALLMLKQSLEGEWAAGQGQLMPRGEYVDLGSFSALVHKHDTKRELGISLMFDEIMYDMSDRYTGTSVYMTFVAMNSGELATGKPSDLANLSEVGYQIQDGKEVLLDAKLEYKTNKAPWYWEMSQLSIKDEHDGREIFKDEYKLSYEPKLFLPKLSLPGLERMLELLRELDVIEDKGIVRKREWEGVSAGQVEEEWVRQLKWERENDRKYEEEREMKEDEQFFWEQEHDRLDPGLEKRWEEIKAEREQNKMRREREWETRLEWVRNLVNGLIPRLKPHQILELTPGDIPYIYENCLRPITYLGPLRSYPERLYMVWGGGKVSSSAGLRGEFTPHILYHNSKIEEEVNTWLEQFGIPYRLKVSEFGDAELSGKYVTITLVDKRTETSVTLADVGFGINQLLPVIIEGVASEPYATLCVEQPEIHLHPRLQANIADLMIETSSRKQWIVETHSELLILRLQRRIRERKIKSSDVSVLYVDPNTDGQGSIIKKLKLDKNGDFSDEWPDGFFDEGFNELMTEDDLEDK